jgi:hypothetical protein
VSPSRAVPETQTRREAKTGRPRSRRSFHMADGRVERVPSLSLMNPATLYRGFNAVLSFSLQGRPRPPVRERTLGFPPEHGPLYDRRCAIDNTHPRSPTKEGSQVDD